ncbi:MAG: hypothetical protein QOG46_617 [Pseudonocardiales bacterium]|nr:hypothetical protein [Pseudonocardiales bacterium]
MVPVRSSRRTVNRRLKDEATTCRIVQRSSNIHRLAGSYLTDLLGRKWTFILFAALSAGLIVAYTHVPTGANTTVLVLGFPLGFRTSAIFSGFGSFLTELYPTVHRGTGLGFTYNTGRGLGALFPTLVGFLTASWGLGGALVLGALAEHRDLADVGCGPAGLLRTAARSGLDHPGLTTQASPPGPGASQVERGVVGSAHRPPAVRRVSTLRRGGSA